MQNFAWQLFFSGVLWCHNQTKGVTPNDYNNPNRRIRTQLNRFRYHNTCFRNLHRHNRRWPQSHILRRQAVAPVSQGLRKQAHNLQTGKNQPVKQKPRGRAKAPKSKPKGENNMETWQIIPWEDDTTKVKFLYNPETGEILEIYE